MFTFFIIIGGIGSSLMFLSWASTEFQNIDYFLFFLSMLTSTLLCYKLLNMESKVKDHETEIENLKKHLDIKHEDPVMNSYIQDLDNKKTGD